MCPRMHKHEKSKFFELFRSVFEFRIFIHLLIYQIDRSLAFFFVSANSYFPPARGMPHSNSGIMAVPVIKRTVLCTFSHVDIFQSDAVINVDSDQICFFHFKIS